jgi:hypothetical protein
VDLAEPSEGLSVPEKAIRKFFVRAVGPYEQEPGETFAASGFRKYVQRWIRGFIVK